MSTWGNSDASGSKPKFNKERQVRKTVFLNTTTIGVANVLAFSSNIANFGIANGMVVNVVNSPGANTSPTPGFFTSNAIVINANTVGNTVTLSRHVTTSSVNTSIQFDTVIPYTSGEEANTYFADTVLATRTRIANTASLGISANSTAHTGWVKVTIGTGGRAGRVQTEVLVALSNTAASSTASGNTSNSRVYYAGT